MIPKRFEFDRCKNPSAAKREREGPDREAVGRVRALGQESGTEQLGMSFSRRLTG
jgi:hypothetical protein